MSTRCLITQRIVRFMGLRVLRTECLYPTGVRIRMATIATEQDVSEQLERLLQIRAQRRARGSRVNCKKTSPARQKKYRTRTTPSSPRLRIHQAGN